MNVRLIVYVVLIAGLIIAFTANKNYDSWRVQTNVTVSVMRLENDTARDPANRNASARFSELAGKIRAPTIAESTSGTGNLHVPVAPPDGPPTVFILAFYRTGSSFTASVLASHPGAFYVYEPWFYIDIKYKNDGRSYATFANGTKRLVTDEYKELLQREELRAWATCDLKNLPLEQFQNDVHFSRHDSLGDFRRCCYSHSSTYCIEELEEKCRKAPLRVFKFIRLRMKNIEGMIYTYPNVKFIHLMRDPRGNVVSRNHAKPTDMVDGSSWYCKTQRNEISEKQRIFSNRPQRIYTIQYEHLAEHPLKYTSEMLRFAGLQMTKSTEDYIEKIALGGIEAKCLYCVERGNATKMASKWRLEVTLPVVLSINEVCGDIIDLLGYKRFDSEQELKDLSIPNIAGL